MSYPDHGQVLLDSYNNNFRVTVFRILQKHQIFPDFRATTCIVISRNPHGFFEISLLGAIL